MNTLQICNLDRDMELSKRISSRLVCDSVPSVCYDPRPVSTKYTDFPLMDARQIPPQEAPPIRHDPHSKFFCGTTKAPWNGFASAIDKESTLRNQFFALQKCEQSEYIPSTHSDMYVDEASPIPPLSITYKQGECKGTFNTSTRIDRLNSNCKC